MPASKESINKDLFNTLKSRGYEPYAKTVADKETSIDQANLFVFKFVKNNQKNFSEKHFAILVFLPLRKHHLAF